ncbi:MAG: hypothetical protein AB7E79_06745 [Rhodospirillaceae bacterium]
MRTGLKLLAAALCAGASVTALASDQNVPSMDSTQFLRTSEFGQASSTVERERPQAVNGSLYSVVAPIYLTSNFTSFLRLFNGGAGDATFTVTVVGSSTATAYGTASFTVPTAGTKQLWVQQDILPVANATNRTNNEPVSLYIQSAQALAGYQHVTLDFNARYFENASVCKHMLQNVLKDASSQVPLLSIHTSRLAAQGYPSQVELHNYANAAVTYRFFVRDAVTGSLLGQMDFAAQANASYTIPMSQIESTIGFNPSESQVHVNLIVTDPTGSPPQVLLSQTIVNNTLNVTLNMTTACAVNAPATGGDGGGLPGGGIAY